MHTTSFGRSRYFLLFIDESHELGLVFETKLEPFQKFMYFKSKIENQSGLYIKTLCIDRGGEFLFEEFSLCCKESGIPRELATL